MSFTRDKPSARALLEALAGAPLPDWLPPDRVRLSAGQSLFEAGRPHPYVYVVSEGLLKLHYLQENGDDWVKSFSKEGMFFGSLSALLPEGLASFSVTALEACELERLHWPSLMALAQRHPVWLRALFEAMRQFAALKEQREYMLLTRSPEQRYASLRDEAPALLQRVPLKELARYLGITPVSLSRIRRRLVLK